MKKIHPALLSALTGLLLYAAWPESPLTFLIFIAFIPLLWLERQGIRRARFFGWVYLSMLIWNIGTTWWIWNSTGPGAASRHPRQQPPDVPALAGLPLDPRADGQRLRLLLPSSFSGLASNISIFKTGASAGPG